MADLRRGVFCCAAALCLLVCGAAIAGEAERAAATKAMNALYEAEQYPQALDACQLLIEYTRDEFGDRSPELIDPLIFYGHIQRKLQHPERAIESYDKAAELIEMNESVFSDRLVSLLRNIGAAYHEDRKSEDSAAALQRAKVITHRNYGIMNLQQLPILDDLTEVYASSDLVAANREQIFALRVNERRYGADSPDLVPGLYHLADWFRRTRQLGAARSLYRRAVSILESEYGPSDLRLVPALTGIADTYRMERTFRGEGRESLERALNVYETTEFPDAVDHGMALIQLGDWYLLTNHREEAVANYAKAWQVLSEDGQGTEVAQKQLGKPVKLRYDDPPPEIDELMPTRNEPVFVEVLFTVTADGTVEDAAVVDSNASNSVKRQVRLAVQQARYRPAFEDGRPVATQVRIRQKYYSQAPTTTASAKGAEPAPKDPASKVPSEATTPGEAGAATDTGPGVPPATAPSTSGDAGDAGATSGDVPVTPAEITSGGGDVTAPVEAQSPEESGASGPDAEAEPPTPPTEPEPESP
jgi:TonB family protein